MVGLLTFGTGFYIFKCTYDPGPVSAAQIRGEPLGGYASHADFESECLLCHMPVHCLHATRCETCHADIARERAQGTGLHGLLPGTKKCQNCHTEHRGRDAVISTLPLDSLASVSHRQLTGFSLANHQVDHEGRPQACDDCHTQHRFKAEYVDCLTCHAGADPAFVRAHAEQYGDDCLGCHDGDAHLADFDHDSVFVLEGAHARAACRDCHHRQPAGECAACHQEPEAHAGSFGLDCTRCHTPQNWNETQLTRHDFPLDHGGQGQPDCETCHIDAYVRYHCYGCHDHRPEQMAQVHAEEEIYEFEDCVECHPTGQPGEGEHYRHERQANQREAAHV
jgi:hypothetical protein